MAGKPGRPTVHTQKIADEICGLLEKGKSLRSICKDDKFPPEATVRRWYVDDRGGFAAQYAKARDIGLDAMADELLDIAKEGSDDVQRDRLRVDTHKWHLSKMAPKRYGDKVQLTGDGGGPIETHELTDTERNHRIAALLNAAGTRRDGQAPDGGGSNLDAPGGAAEGGSGE